jgi:hypothetical protein
MKRTRNKPLVPLLALMLVMSALFFSVPAFAADDPDPENLTVDAVWLEGETLNIEVTDKQTDVHQTLRLSLNEYAAGSEYVSVRAVDKNGNKSNTIQFKNPFYTSGAEKETDPDSSEPTEIKQPEESESAIPDGWTPFTPDGAGTVIDNVTEADGKEFFSIETEDGNVFYLIVDRQRQTDNVYLLNAVTEDDLLALAESGDGASQSAIPTQDPGTQPPPQVAASPEPEPSAAPADNGGMTGGTVIFIVIAAIAVGGAGYYFKILRPKRMPTGMDDEGEDDYDEDGDPDDDDEDYGDPGEDGDER